MKNRMPLLLRALALLASILLASSASAQSNGYGSAPGTGGGGSTSVTGTGLWYSASGSLNSAAVGFSGDVSIAALSGGNVPTTVLAVHGSTVPAGGALTTGNVLQVTGASALGYAAVNLAGGPNYVTGTLPAGNQAAQAMGGAVGGTTAASTISLTGNASITGALPVANLAPGTSAQVLMSNGTPATTWTTFSGDVTVSATGVTTVKAISGATPILITPNALTWTAATTTPTISQQTSTSGNGVNLLIQSQGPLSAGTNVPGNIILNTPAPISTGVPGIVQVQGGGTAYVAMGELSNASAFGAIWLGTPAASPSSTNYALDSSNGTNTSLNSSSTINFQISAVSDLVFNSSGLNWGQAVTTQAVFGQTIRSSDLATNPLTIQAQSAFATASSNPKGGDLILAAGLGATSAANYQSGNINLQLGAPLGTGTEAFVNVQRAGTTLVALGAQVGTVANGAIYFAGVSPSSTNYALSGSSTVTTLNAPTSLSLGIAGTSVASMNSTSVLFKVPISASGVALSYGSTSVALTTSTGNVLSSAQYNFPRLKFTGTLTGAGTTITLPATEGAFWICDFDGVIFGGNTITLIANGNNWGTVISALTTVVLIYYIASEGKLYGVSLSP